MHDPLTVAFQIMYPWGHWSSYPNGDKYFYRAPLVTIWHKDPERDGTDNSCDWFDTKLTKRDKAALEKALTNGREWAEDGKNYIDRVFAPCDYRDIESVTVQLWVAARNYFRPRPWWKHPRFHFWHYRIQIHPWQTLRRWLFERCSKCGKRYPWGYCPVGNWSGTETWHFDCENPDDNGMRAARLVVPKPTVTP